MFAYDNELLANLLWEELTAARMENVKLRAQLKVAAAVVNELQRQVPLPPDEDAPSMVGHPESDDYEQ